MLRGGTCLAPGTDHGAVGNQSDQSIWWQQAQADHQGVSESLEIGFIHACVDNEKKDGRDRSRARQRVLDCCIFGQQLRREVGIGNILVVRGEAISLQTKGTDPELSSHVDLAASAKR